ncbi:MAG TPA: hypothetical protein VL171_17005 [Verrucomicrobiae bacterium]|nr:hypothetical protein [Verrucomicrobiae bacterium]
MKKKQPIDRGLTGRWTSCDEFGSTVEYRISIVRGEYRVGCVDTFDGERAEVYDIRGDGDRLRFCAHWPSTGRFSKNSVFWRGAGGADQAELTYTYTDTELLRRRPTKKGLAEGRQKQVEQAYPGRARGFSTKSCFAVSFVDH